MNFATNINTVLQNDTALNALITDTAGNVNIYSYDLPDNFPVNISAIVFTYKKENGEHTLQLKNVLEYYSLYIVVLAYNSEDLETIGAAVRDLLDEYSDSHIKDITYEDDLNGQDPDTERYYKTLQYSIIYKN